KMPSWPRRNWRKSGWPGSNRFRGRGANRIGGLFQRRCRIVPANPARTPAPAAPRLTLRRYFLYTRLHRKRGLMKIFRLIAVCAMCCAGIWAQGVAQIQGTVQDSSGLAIGGAEVKATQTDTGIVRSTVSGADGVYVLPNLPVGPYRMEVAKT